MIVVTSGGFDPIHPGHIEYLRRAKQDRNNYKHICIVNSDAFLDQKKGYHVQDWVSRMTIVQAIEYVDEVMPAIDTDNTVCATLAWIRNLYPDEDIVFVKGGDRKANEIPEAEICEKLGIMISDTAGEKVTSSQTIIRSLYENYTVCKS